MYNILDKEGKVLKVAFRLDPFVNVMLLKLEKPVKKAKLRALKSQFEIVKELVTALVPLKAFGSIDSGTKRLGQLIVKEVTVKEPKTLAGIKVSEVLGVRMSCGMTIELLLPVQDDFIEATEVRLQLIRNEEKSPGGGVTQLQGA